MIRPQSLRHIDIQRFHHLQMTPAHDGLAVEEPLEIRVDGHPIAVVMRTPGNDEDLVRGFLLTEGIASPAQIRRIEIVPSENRALVFLTEDAEFDLARLSRHLFSASSCGICGKATLEAVFAGAAPLERPWFPPAEALLAAPAKLREAQTLFNASGGLHGAGLHDPNGTPLVVREDVGRHNAVDKVVGHALAMEADLSECFLLVSGRVSFEIMQKALAARIPAVAAISAPSSLAVEFARTSRQALVGFLRPPGFNRYA